MSNTAVYDEQIRALMEECRQLSATRDSRAPETLSRLRKIAEGMDDPGLLGFVYFHTANYHFISADYDGFHKNLGLAIRCLLRSDAYELLARTYNFFAVEAQNKGAMDIAYNYYMSALQFVKDKEDSPIRGFLLVNLAGLFSHLEYYQESRRYFHKGLSLLKKNKKDMFYHRNMIASYIIGGLNYLAMGDVPAAQKAYRAASRILHAADASVIQEIRVIYAVFEIRIALSLHEKKKVREQAALLAKSLVREEAVYESMDDIRDICRLLIEEGFFKEAEQIIDAADERVMASNVTHAMLQLTEVKVDYYERIGDEKKLMESLTEQNRLFLLSTREQQELYHYSIEYVRLINELKDEEVHLRKENAMLQEQADTDALCGIPNRYAMDREMERAFERAYATRTSLGIGLLDVDRFKEVNDTYGHQAGDRYLAMIGRELAKIARDDRIFCARYGGDEFLIIYEGMEDAEIRKKAGEISRAIAKRKITMKGKTIGKGVRVSQGICHAVPRQKTRPWDYLSGADAALYQAKRTAGLKEHVAFSGLPDRRR